MEIDKKQREELYDRVLVSVGRAPNYVDGIGENTGSLKTTKALSSVTHSSRPKILISTPSVT